ncbi:hypothetical protein [Streptomyces sp. NPDC060035]|uniref:DUF7878 domain-containing protein n=1 Tax=Streptomyces sp. NPDC060035 TaxID=3347044 RepID=UPI0036796B96
MEFTYTNITTDELHGTRLEEFLINIEADITIADDGRIVFSEGRFPVTELARDLTEWATSGNPAPDRDFEWDSMSFAELGAIRIQQREGGWRLGSAYDPEVWSSSLPWAALSQAIYEYVKHVRADVEKLGINPSFIP